MKNYSRQKQKKEFQKKRQYARIKKQIHREENMAGGSCRSAKFEQKLHSMWDDYTDGSDILYQICAPY